MPCAIACLRSCTAQLLLRYDICQPKQVLCACPATVTGPYMRIETMSSQPSARELPGVPAIPPYCTDITDILECLQQLEQLEHAVWICIAEPPPYAMRTRLQQLFLTSPSFTHRLDPTLISSRTQHQMPTSTRSHGHTKHIHAFAEPPTFSLRTSHTSRSLIERRRPPSRSSGSNQVYFPTPIKRSPFVQALLVDISIPSILRNLSSTSQFQFPLLASLRSTI